MVDSVYFDGTPTESSPPAAVMPVAVSATHPLPVTAAAGSPVSVSIADGADVAQGATTDVAYAGSGASTEVALLKAIANSALSTTPTTVQGGTASDGAVSYSPVTVGGRASSTALPTAVSAAGDVVNAMTDLYGRQVSPAALRGLKVAVTPVTITTSTARTQIVAADASNKLDLYGLVLNNTSASACTVLIEDGTTSRMSFTVPANETRGFMGSVDSGIPQAAVNTAWNATCGTSITSMIVTPLVVKDA